MSTSNSTGQQFPMVLGGKSFVLRADGSLYDADTNSLLVADLHLGKDASFRQAGLPVPAGMVHSILDALETAVCETGAQRLIVLGDLIHNRASFRDELRTEFSEWRSRTSVGDVILVEGNHDRHVARFPADWGLVIESQLLESDIRYVHQTSESAKDQRFEIGGHLHPVVKLSDKVDRLRLRCFVLDKHRLILPAFGIFKGGLTMKPIASRQFFPIAENEIWKC